MLIMLPVCLVGVDHGFVSFIVHNECDYFPRVALFCAIPPIKLLASVFFVVLCLFSVGAGDRSRMLRAGFLSDYPSKSIVIHARIVEDKHRTHW